MGHEDDNRSTSPILVSTKDFFREVVTDAFEKRKLKSTVQVKTYLVDLLEFYVPAANLFDEVDANGRRTQKTLAETFLRAQNSDYAVKVELLKKLGDRSLYISGFFADSLQRKLIDIDYYADMGVAAYGALAATVKEDTVSRTYGEIGKHFLDFVEVLTYVSSRAHLHNEENILRLFETYARTGSESARERLIEKGLVPAENISLKKSQ